MPCLPLAARWTTRKDSPIFEFNQDAAGHKTKKIVGYKQDGVVWQAEELQSGGRWQRYYGFVGCHGVARVPAEEIEFPWDWFAATKAGVSMREMSLEPLAIADAVDIGWTSPVPEAYGVIGSPLVCRLLARNHTSMERTLPPLAFGVDPAPPLGHTVTIDTRLWWVHPLGYFAYQDRNWPWMPLNPKTLARPTLNQPQRSLAPGEVFEVLRWELNEQFGHLRPGLYGFRTKLAGSPQTPLPEGPYVWFVLTGGGADARGVSLR